VGFGWGEKNGTNQDGRQPKVIQEPKEVPPSQPSLGQQITRVKGYREGLEGGKRKGKEKR